MKKVNIKKFIIPETVVSFNSKTVSLQVRSAIFTNSSSVASISKLFNTAKKGLPVNAEKFF